MAIASATYGRAGDSESRKAGEEDRDEEDLMEFEQVRLRCNAGLVNASSLAGRLIFLVLFVVGSENCLQNLRSHTFGASNVVWLT